MSQLCLLNSNYQIIAYYYLKLYSPKTRLNIFWTILIPMEKASKFLKKQKKQSSIFRLLNNNQKLKQMKVIKMSKNGFLTNLLTEKMQNAVLMEVQCPRTSYVYVCVSGLYIPPNHTFSKIKKILFLCVTDMYKEKALHEQHHSATMKNNYVEEITSRRKRHNLIKRAAYITLLLKYLYIGFFVLFLSKV